MKTNNLPPQKTPETDADHETTTEEAEKTIPDNPSADSGKKVEANIGYGFNYDYDYTPGDFGIV